MINRPFPETAARSVFASDRREPRDAMPEAEHGADVLELTSAMEIPRDTRGSEFHAVSGQPDVMFVDEMAHDQRPGSAAADHAPRSQERTLLSDQVTSAVSSAFGSLAHTVLLQNARTLDDLVGDMLRPMLKTWLDDNLPTIVERLVRAEIERVSRGRG